MRVDSGVQQGDSVGVNYDPMIAKLVCRSVSTAVVWVAGKGGTRRQGAQQGVPVWVNYDAMI